jgi:hypothetical protein
MEMNEGLFNYDARAVITLFINVVLTKWVKLEIILSQVFCYLLLGSRKAHKQCKVTYRQCRIG